MKKKFTFVSLMIFIALSFAFILSTFLSTGDVKSSGIRNAIFISLAGIGFLVYYIKSNDNDQLVPATIITENKKNENTSTNNHTDISFQDVAGLHEVKEELHEIIDFINNSAKFTKMGAKIPKGILFYGPPGTGKTLLARALAGETKSTFLYSSGSEFVEKYVGVGAKRIRTLFEKAKKEAPTIIFIDEIDAIGSKRNSDSNNEKDQTLNQLLVEMDGYNKNGTVVIIGATNRLDLIDEALLRPGRFDRHMFIGNPNVQAREEILNVHMKNKPIDESINILDFAKKTHGFSGAQLANIANEAAIIAVRRNKNKIDVDDFNTALERVIGGLEVKHPSVLAKEKHTVAHHEAGHAIVSKLLMIDIIQKISIVPRGQALGYVLKFPNEDRYLLTQEELLSKIKVLLGGRAAEQIFFNEVTTGASDDLSKATEIAQSMICNYGMSSFGNITINKQFIQYNINEINNEVKLIIDSCYEDTLQLIKENKMLISLIADYLIENETIETEELDYIFTQHQYPLKSAN